MFIVIVNAFAASLLCAGTVLLLSAAAAVVVAAVTRSALFPEQCGFQSSVRLIPTSVLHYHATDNGLGFLELGGTD